LALSFCVYFGISVFTSGGKLISSFFLSIIAGIFTDGFSFVLSMISGVIDGREAGLYTLV
jgi:hypothetical protein